MYPSLSNGTKLHIAVWPFRRFVKRLSLVMRVRFYRTDGDSRNHWLKLFRVYSCPCLLPFPSGSNRRQSCVIPSIIVHALGLNRHFLPDSSFFCPQPCQIGFKGLQRMETCLHCKAMTVTTSRRQRIAFISFLHYQYSNLTDLINQIRV